MFRALKSYPSGLKPEYTWFTDFDIAINYGKKAVIDTYEAVMTHHKDNYRSIGEAAISTNLLLWDIASNENYSMEIKETLEDIYYKLKDFYCDNFLSTDEGVKFYFENMD